MTVTRDSPDTVLLLGVARGDAGALEEIYHRYSATVYGLAVRVLRDSSSAEEVVQEVFVRLWSSPERFDSSRGSLRSFLCTQAHSRCVDLIRSETARRARQERGATREATRGDEVEVAVTNLLLAEQLRVAIGELPENERRAIELAYFAGMTYVEVAQFLEEPEGTVKSRIRNGLRSMHHQLSKLGLSLGEVAP